MVSIEILSNLTYFLVQIFEFLNHFHIIQLPPAAHKALPDMILEWRSNRVDIDMDVCLPAE